MTSPNDPPAEGALDEHRSQADEDPSEFENPGPRPEEEPADRARARGSDPELAALARSAPAWLRRLARYEVPTPRVEVLARGAKAPARIAAEETGAKACQQTCVHEHGRAVQCELPYGHAEALHEGGEHTGPVVWWSSQRDVATRAELVAEAALLDSRWLSRDGAGSFLFDPLEQISVEQEVARFDMSQRFACGPGGDRARARVAAILEALYGPDALADDASAAEVVRKSRAEVAERMEAARTRRASRRGGARRRG